MPETRFDLAAMKQIKLAREVGSAADGQAVTLQLETEAGQTEWVAVHHARLGQLVASLLFGATVAASDRRTARDNGKPSLEQSTLIDIVRVNAASAPGADHVCLRVVLGEGANLDFRIPLAVVPALQDKLAQALSAAQAAPGSAHA
jgi:hypothetical protein